MSKKPWHGQTVVIVDDSSKVRDELTGLLTGCGMKVLGTAENGVLGLDLVRKLQPNLVTLDIIMPEMDGVECYRRLMREHPSLRCAMISWLASDPAVAEKLTEVVSKHILQAKPVSMTDLEACLTRVYLPEQSQLSGRSEKKAPKDKDSDDDLLELGLALS